MTQFEVKDSEDEDDGESPPLSPQSEAASADPRIDAPSHDELSRVTSSTDTAAFRKTYREQDDAIREIRRVAGKDARPERSDTRDPYDFPESQDTPAERGPRKWRKLREDDGISRTNANASLFLSNGASQDELSRGMMYTSSLPYDQSHTAPPLGQRLLDLDGMSSGTHVNSSPRVLAPEAPMMEGGLTLASTRTPPRSWRSGQKLGGVAEEAPKSSMDVLAIGDACEGQTFQIAPLGMQLLQAERERTDTSEQLSREEDGGSPGDSQNIEVVAGKSAVERGATPMEPANDIPCEAEQDFQAQDSDASDDYENTHVKRKRPAAKKPRGRPKRAKPTVTSKGIIAIDDDDAPANPPPTVANEDTAELQDGPSGDEMVAEKTRATAKSKKGRGRPKKAKPVVENEEDAYVEDGVHMEAAAIPVKVADVLSQEDAVEAAEDTAEREPLTRTRKGRGRPRKKIADHDLVEMDELADANPPALTKKGRGRPVRAAQVSVDIVKIKDETAQQNPDSASPPRDPSSPENTKNTFPPPETSISKQTLHDTATKTAVSEDSASTSPGPISAKKEASQDIKTALTRAPKRPVPRVGFSKRDRVPSLLKIIKR